MGVALLAIEMALRQLFCRGMRSLRTYLQAYGVPRGEYQAVEAYVIAGQTIDV